MAEDAAAAGCERCRQNVYSAGWERMTLRAESIPRHARLWRCDACGAYWEEGEREAHVVGETEARRDFPEAFETRP